MNDRRLPIERPTFDAVCDGGDLDCGSGLLLIIRRAMAPLQPDQVLEIQSREASVSVDLPAWCGMVGHIFEGQWPAQDGYTYYHVRKQAEKALPTTIHEDLEAAEQYVWRVRLQYRAAAPARAFSRNVDWQVGTPASFGEEVDAPSAIDLFLSSIADDILMGFSQVASEYHLVIDDMEISTTAQLENILVHLGIEEGGTPRVASVGAVLYVSSTASREQLERVWQDTLRRSPLIQTIMPTTAMKLRWLLV